MEFLFEYGLFMAKIGSVILLLSIAISVIIFVIMNAKVEKRNLIIKNLNDKYEFMSTTLNSQILNKKELKKYLKNKKQQNKEKPEQENKAKLFVLNFKGDIKASSVSSLREEITAILTIAEPRDEVLIILESAGGTVHGYGLGASQLRRVRDRNIKLTVSVDKVAASGGYMMACVANKIIAAPFAIIGSIGVLAQIPNFHRLLKKMNIDFEQITAGEYKRTLTLFGKNTKEDRNKVKEDIENTHELFKSFVKENRTQVDIEAIATGEHWYGQRAIELKLVDELITSDDYLINSAKHSNVFEIKVENKKKLSEKLFSTATVFLDKLKGV